MSMKVYLFKVDKDKVGREASGQAIVAAKDPSEAWDALKAELPGYDLAAFDEGKFEVINALTSLQDEPAVLAYNCYY